MAKRALTPKEARQGIQAVRTLLEHHFGKRDSGRARIVALAGGISNRVFAVRHAEGRFIVRLGNDPSKISDFLKEQWAIATVREKGVPAPEVLQVGNSPADAPYMIARQSEGQVASDHPERMKIIRELGCHAASINSIETEGYGCTFNWSHNRLSRNESWSDFLKDELKIENKLEVLAAQKMLDSAKVKRLRSALQSIGARNRPTVLNHGDLRLKNVLADEAGKIGCILDWEHCMSNVAPEWELSLALHDLGIDAKQEFLAGYGLSAAELSAMAPALKAITMINYAGTVQRAADTKDRAKLEALRTRLSGDLDLYSL